MTRFVVFIGIVLSLLAGIHYYIWARLVRDPHLPAPWNTLATVLLVVLGISIPGAMVAGRLVPGLRHLVVWPAYVWMGLMFLLFVGVIAADLVRATGAIGRKLAGGASFDAERRTFLARLGAAAVGLVAAATGVFALRSALGPIQVNPVRVRLRRLPPEQNGFRIAQLTDIHVGPTIGRAFIEEIVRRTNELSPDVVAITGDLVDGSVVELRDAVAPLGRLRARHGVYFVTGNHEYFSGAAEWLEELERIGIKVLRNERIAIADEDGRPGFDLAGVDDRSASRYGGIKPAEALQKALAGRDPNRELVLLAHQPRSLFDAEGFDVGLQISGHTHGGQIWPFRYLVRLQQPFVAGLHRHGDAQIYVSRGTGYWGPPMRLGAPAEITELTLESDRARA